MHISVSTDLSLPVESDGIAHTFVFSVPLSTSEQTCVASSVGDAFPGTKTRTELGIIVASPAHREVETALSHRTRWERAPSRR